MTKGPFLWRGAMSYHLRSLYKLQHDLKQQQQQQQQQQQHAPLN
jgi:hypothetical protein